MSEIDYTKKSPEELLLEMIKGYEDQVTVNRNKAEITGEVGNRELSEYFEQEAKEMENIVESYKSIKDNMTPKDIKKHYEMYAERFLW